MTARPRGWSRLPCYCVGGRPYRPSNGTEGDIFREVWCGGCEREAAHRSDADQPGCPILLYAYAHDLGDDDYPAEWVYSDSGYPTCTAFVPEGEQIPYRCPHTMDLFLAT